MNAKLLLPFLLLAAACGVDNGSSVVIMGRVQTPVWVSTGCIFTPGMFDVGTGTLDLNGPGLYEMALEVQNNMTDPTSTNGQAGSRTWKAYEVSTRVINASDFYPKQVNVAAHEVTAADSTAVLPGTANLGVQTIVGQQMAGDIAAAVGALAPGEVRLLQLGVRLLGKTADGVEVDTSESTYPLQVCYGCLVTPPTCPTGKTVTNVGNCYPTGEDQLEFQCQ